MEEILTQCLRCYTVIFFRAEELETVRLSTIHICIWDPRWLRYKRYFFRQKAQIVSRHGGEEEASRQEGRGQHEGGDALNQGRKGHHPLGSQKRRHENHQIPPLSQGR